MLSSNLDTPKQAKTLAQGSEPCLRMRTIEEMSELSGLREQELIELARSSEMDARYFETTGRWMFFHDSFEAFATSFKRNSSNFLKLQNNSDAPIQEIGDKTTSKIMSEVAPEVVNDSQVHDNPTSSKTCCDQEINHSDVQSQKNPETTETDNNESSFIQFLQNFKPGNKTKVIPGYSGMSISASRKKKTIRLRQNKNDQYFNLITYPVDHVFKQEDIETLIKAHKRFRDRIEAQIPWRDINFLLNGTYRELKTINDFLEFCKEGKSTIQTKKIIRYQKRYASNGYGDKSLANYCAESFRQDFLDRKPPGHQPSDRNELIKIFSSGISAAKGMSNIKIDVQQLFRKGERARADKSDNKPPMLRTLKAFICKAYELRKYNLVLELIIQFMASTRVACTDDLEWSQVKWEKLCIEIPEEKSKSGYVNLPIPKRLIEILKAEYHAQCQNAKLTDGKNSEPIYIFESKRNKGKSICNMDAAFKYVKKQLLIEAVKLGLTEEEIEDIESFTRHSTRSLVEDLLIGLHASEAQKEKCLGRKPNEVGIAYAKIDLKTLSKLKDRMVEKVEQEFPELKALFNSLIRHDSNVMLESGGVKKGVKNLAPKPQTLI